MPNATAAVAEPVIASIDISYTESTIVVVKGEKTYTVAANTVGVLGGFLVEDELGQSIILAATENEALSDLLGWIAPR